MLTTTLRRICDSRIVATAMLAMLCLLHSSCGKLKQLLPAPAPVTPPPAETAAENDKAAKPAEGEDLFGPEKMSDPEAPKATPFELNKSAMVSILLYHDFVERIPKTEMMVSVPTFRSQMQALKDANITVIPMSDLLAWKRGEKNIPDESAVITLDDGWVGEHQLAYPIMKEFGYPFTIYLYKKYVGVGGRSMTVEQIKEMLNNGGELGSHTISHQPLTNKKGKTDEQYHAWLHEEIAESKKWLEQTFGVPCQTLAYPYGIKNEDVVKLAQDSGYEAAVTVNPQKATWDTPNGLLGRFTQQWDKDTNFKLASNFHGRNDMANSKFVKTDAVNESGEKLINLKPAPNSTISERRPVIEANLSKLGGIVPDSVLLRVSGYGAVPVEFDATNQTVRYQIPQRIRLDDCTATLGFRRTSSDKDEVISWKFKIEQKASYLPQVITETTTQPAP